MKRKRKLNKPVRESDETSKEAIDILATIVNDLQSLGDSADSDSMVPEEDGGLSPKAREQLASDAFKANDILTRTLSSIESEPQNESAEFRNLRTYIRELLISEQVVGFNIGAAPAAAKYGSGALGDSAGDDEDYLSLGTSSGSTEVPVDADSEEESGALDSDLQTLTQQRQKELNKGDTVDARATGRQLSAVRSKLG